MPISKAKRQLQEFGLAIKRPNILTHTTTKRTYKLNISELGALLRDTLYFLKMRGEHIKNNWDKSDLPASYFAQVNERQFTQLLNGEHTQTLLPPVYINRHQMEEIKNLTPDELYAYSMEKLIPFKSLWLSVRGKQRIRS